MGKVRTILGDVDSSDLGIVDAHEHLIRTGGLEILRKTARIGAWIMLKKPSTKSKCLPKQAAKPLWT